MFENIRFGPIMLVDSPESEKHHIDLALRDLVIPLSSGPCLDLEELNFLPDSVNGCKKVIYTIYYEKFYLA